MELPPYTRLIFDHLRQGYFLSANTLDARQQEMYQQLRRYEERLRAYFEPLGLTLKQGAGYYYFAQEASESDLSKQVQKMSSWFDEYLLFKLCQPNWGPGTILTLAELTETVSQQKHLNKLLQRRTAKSTAGTADQLTALLRKWERASFVQQIQEEPLTYEVLNSVDYLEQVIRSIPTQTASER